MNIKIIMDISYFIINKINYENYQNYVNYK